jgi:hypothetical protein
MASNIYILKKNEITGELEPFSNENIKDERTQMNENFQVNNFLITEGQNLNQI